MDISILYISWCLVIFE